MTHIPGTPRRPATVSAASIVLSVVVLVDLVAAVLGWIVLDSHMDAIRDVISGASHDPSYADENANSVISGYVQGVLISSAVLLAFSVSYAVNGLLILAGKNVARILIWVTAGLDVGFTCCGLALNAAPPDTDLIGGGTLHGADLQQAISDAEPVWAQAIRLPATAAWAIALIAAVVLLALPASHAFFRRPALVPPPP